MYLLMLLAAFISQIYGFNLSARPDYDRDIAVKKARSVIYKFLFQEKEVQKLTKRVIAGKMGDFGLPLSGLPDDMIYAHFDALDKTNCGSPAEPGSKIPGYINDTTLYYQATLDEHSDDSRGPFHYYMRRYDENYSLCQDSEDKNGDNAATDVLPVGRQFFSSNQMISRLVCLNEELQEGDGVKNCSIYELDEEGNIVMEDDGEGNMVPKYIKDGSGNVKSCCSSGKRYLISYMKLDPRWINRVTNEVSFDMLSAISGYDYSENLGVITWHNGSSSADKYWLFRGKMHFRPSFLKEKDEWCQAHPGENYPHYLTQRSVWKMPKYFKENYFTDITTDHDDFCKPACLFKIRNI